MTGTSTESLPVTASIIAINWLSVEFVSPMYTNYKSCPLFSVDWLHTVLLAMAGEWEKDADSIGMHTIEVLVQLYTAL